MNISLRQERLDRGLTVAAAAKKAKVSTSAWQRAETGIPVHPRNAKAIADFLEVKPSDIWPVEEMAA